MPKSSILAAVVAITVILAYLWSAFVRQSAPDAIETRSSSPFRPGAEVEPATTTPDTPAAATAVDQTNTDPRFTRFTDGTVHLRDSLTASRRLHQSNDPRADLEIINQLIADYRLVYRENPVGTENAEIVDQLRGDNPKKVVFIDPELSALTADGQLLDRWGSPFIFHPLTSELMDIRSPGPDKKPWTQDDLTLDLQEKEAELGLHPDQ